MLEEIVCAAHVNIGFLKIVDLEADGQVNLTFLLVKLALLCFVHDFYFFLFTSLRELHLPRYFGDCAFFPCPPHTFAELTSN